MSNREHSWTFLFLALAIIALTFPSLFSSCGLQDFMLLEPINKDKIPTQVDNQITSYVYDQENSTNNSFIGHELYYKVYSSSGTLGGSTPYESEKSLIESSGVNPLRTLSDKGYRRLNKAGDSYGATNKPLIQISKTNYRKINLLFNSIDDAFPSEATIEVRDGADNLITQETLYRTATTSSGSFKSFKNPNSYLTTDIDIPSDFHTQTFAYLCVFALSYGIDDSFNEIYSVPVALNSIQIK